MKMLGSLASKIVRPCARLLRVFKFRLRKPLFVSSLRLRPRRLPKETSLQKTRKPSVLRSFRTPKKTMSGAGEDDSVSEGRQKLFTSPLTPAFMKAAKRGTGEGSVSEEVEDACRSFENYLMEMMVEEGRVTDLMDIEELLYCWKNLNSPLFIDLVCTFYGELCKDLFSSHNEDDRP